jgi:hypothetical protein
MESNRERAIKFMDVTKTAPISCLSLRSSPVHGHGLFTTSEFPANTILTVYPPHYVIYRAADGKDSFMLADKTVHGHEFKREYWDYGIEVTEELSIVGNPKVALHSGLIGHMANDGAYTPGMDLGDYDRMSKLHNNSEFQIYHDRIVLVSTRDITDGEEVLTEYGHGYWLTRSTLQTPSSEYPGLSEIGVKELEV